MHGAHGVRLPDYGDKEEDEDQGHDDDEEREQAVEKDGRGGRWVAGLQDVTFSSIWRQDRLDSRVRCRLCSICFSFRDKPLVGRAL